MTTGVGEFVWAPVVTIAHIIVIPNQLLEDAPAFRTTLETRMLNALIVAEDQQILNGTGTAGQMLGILTTPGLATAVAATPPAVADAILEQYMAIYAATYIQPTGIVLAPDSLVAVATSEGDGDGRVFPDRGAVRSLADAALGVGLAGGDFAGDGVGARRWWARSSRKRSSTGMAACGWR